MNYGLFVFVIVWPFRGLNIFYFKITMIKQTYMAYTQTIGLERKHKLVYFFLLHFSNFNTI